MLDQALFYKRLSCCQQSAPRHGVWFKNRLIPLDASAIDLCLSVFPGAKFRTTKGAVKLHVELDHDGYLPCFVAVTDGATHDATEARTLALPRDSIVFMDRAYNDYA